MSYLCTCQANKFDSNERIEGGICKFYNPITQQDEVLMLHQNRNGLPTVTRIDPLTIKMKFDRLEWLFDWIKLYEISTGKIKIEEFKFWMNGVSSGEPKI